MWLFCAIWPSQLTSTKIGEWDDCDKVGFIFDAHLVFLNAYTHSICIGLCVLYIHTHTDVSVFIWLFTPDLKLVVLLANNWKFVVILEWYRCDLKFRGRKSLGLKEHDFLTLSPGVLWPCVWYFYHLQTLFDIRMSYFSCILSAWNVVFVQQMFIELNCSSHIMTSFSFSIHIFFL